MAHQRMFEARSRRAFVLAGAAAMLIAAVASGCADDSRARAAAAPTKVVLVGDSFAQEAAPYLQTLIGDMTLVPKFFGGTAPCDWVGEGLQADATSVVLISFTGNSLTECMTDGNGGFLSGQVLVDVYRIDVQALVDEAVGAGAHVLLVGQPVHAGVVPGNEVVDGINAFLTDITAQDNTGLISFVDAGAAIENPDGTYAEQLPCLPEEPECAASGSNDVRNTDGYHFCPGTSAPGSCEIYSSGAFRFANAMATAVQQL